MVICSCNCVKENQIKELIEQDYTLNEICNTLGCGNCCGTCYEYVKEIFEIMNK